MSALTLPVGSNERHSAY